MAILDLDAERGKYAVYTGDQNDAPLTNPLGNLPRLKWHADLNVIGAEHRPVTLNINPRSWSKDHSSNGKPLFAHGKAFRPLVFGVAHLRGHPVPTQGSFIADVGAQKVLYRIFSDGTYVRLFWENTLGTFTGIPADVTNVTFDLYVCNMGLTLGGSPVLPPDFEGVEATPSRFRSGKFDTDDMHFIADPFGEIMFYRGASLLIERTANALAVKQSVAGYTVNTGATGSFSASVVRTTAK